jgi:hypothetical protein
MRTITSKLTRSLGVLAVGGGLAVASLGFLTQVQPPPASPVESIRAGEIEDKVRHLASDEFMGRGNGTPELDRAADYIAGVFAENGLEPGGDNGFFQEFTVERLSLGAENRLEVPSRSVSLEAGRDFIPLPGSVDGEVAGRLVFAGYGIRAWETGSGPGYDDLEGLDLEGRIAVVLEGFPRSADPASPFNVLSSADPAGVASKAENAEAAGARALVLVQGPLGGARTSIGYYAGAMQPGLSPRRSIMELAPGVGDARIPVVVVSRAASLRLVPELESLQRSIDTGLRSMTRDLGEEARLRVDLDRDGYTARNVIGIVRGSDPGLGHEAIVVGAHYDHDGVEGGRIWNGADDNASGTSGLLELAEAFAMDAPPPRTVVLAAWAGEEKGMLGSRNYVREAPVPISDTVAMFQIDMIGRNEDHPANPAEGFLLERDEENTNALNMIGSVFSADLRNVVEEANQAVGLDLKFRYDYRAENLIQRSDHWTFLSRGVPSLFFFGGLHPDYHTPEDTAEKINYPKIEKVVRLVYLALGEIGSSPDRLEFSDPGQGEGPTR